MTNTTKKEYLKEYKIKNKERLKIYNDKYNKEHYEDNTEYMREYSKEYYEENKEKLSKRSKEYYLENKDNLRIPRWKYQGIIAPNNDWKALLKLYLETENCEICGRSKNDLKKALSVDHCHKTGKFRGFLCNGCNAGIGGLQDNIDIVRKAAEYLNNRKK